MILLIDVGNSRIKWARLSGRRLGGQQAAVHDSWSVEDFQRRLFGRGPRVSRVVVSSVAGSQVNQKITRAARNAIGVRPEFVQSARRAGGVTTLYVQPWRLGVDRFVAAIGAHRFAKGRPVCVVNVGTAMTIDLVDGQGRHLGGAIIPGPRLMVSSLLANTDGILRRALGLRGGRSIFARNTHAALEQGARYAAASAVDRAIEEASKVLGRRPLLLLSGGAAGEIRRLIRSPLRVVPDIVLRGLAVLATE